MHRATLAFTRLAIGVALVAILAACGALRGSPATSETGGTTGPAFAASTVEQPSPTPDGRASIRPAVPRAATVPPSVVMPDLGGIDADLAGLEAALRADASASLDEGSDR